MTKEVLIRVQGLQAISEEGEQEPIELVVPGEYYFRNGSHYLKYEEMLDDTARPTVNYIKMSGKGMEVRKKGLVNVHMVFEPGKKNMSYYTTPFGTLEMGISATRLEISEEQDILEARVHYSMDMNSEYYAECYLEIEVQAKDSAHFTF